VIAELCAAGFVPFAFGAADNLARLDPAPLGAPLRRLPAEAPTALRFHQQLSALNAAAFGGMGMPAWVQLDLGALPSAFIGWALPADQLPLHLAQQLGAADGDLVPVAETLAVPTLVPGRVMSCSMASLLPGRHLGLAAKLLGLAALGATEALGVTQYDNPALRSHTRLGDLEIVQPHLPFHSRPDVSFLYRLRVTPALLAAADRGDAPSTAPAERLAPADAGGWIASRGGNIVAPGLITTPEGARVCWAP
jgi:hypothetical protein